MMRLPCGYVLAFELLSLEKFSLLYSHLIALPEDRTYWI